MWMITIEKKASNAGVELSKWTKTEKGWCWINYTWTGAKLVPRIFFEWMRTNEFVTVQLNNWESETNRPLRIRNLLYTRAHIFFQGVYLTHDVRLHCLGTQRTGMVGRTTIWQKLNILWLSRDYHVICFVQCKIYGFQDNITVESTIFVLNQPYFLAVPAPIIQFAGAIEPIPDTIRDNRLPGLLVLAQPRRQIHSSPREDTVCTNSKGAD